MFVVSQLSALRYLTWVVKSLYLELQMHHFDCQPWWSPPNYPDNTKSSQGTCNRHQYWQLGVKITRSQSSTCSLKTSWMCTANWGASFSCIIIISLCGSQILSLFFSFPFPYYLLCLSIMCKSGLYNIEYLCISTWISMR